VRPPPYTETHTRTYTHAQRTHHASCLLLWQDTHTRKRKYTHNARTIVPACNLGRPQQSGRIHATPAAAAIQLLLAFGAPDEQLIAVCVESVCVCECM
jgi:hypothetical protein